MSGTKSPKALKSKAIVEQCPQCGLMANLIGRPTTEGKIMTTAYECPKGHTFSKKFDLEQFQKIIIAHYKTACLAPAMGLCFFVPSAIVEHFCGTLSARHCDERSDPRQSVD